MISQFELKVKALNRNQNKSELAINRDMKNILKGDSNHYIAILETIKESSEKSELKKDL